MGRTRLTASTWARACTPVPSTASTAASSRASSRTESAEQAAVRSAVTTSPSITASGAPVAGSKTATMALWVGRPLAAFWGNIATSLAASAPAPARYAGIAISTPSTSATSAAVRLGNDPFPALMSAIAAATASTSRSGSSAASTSRLLRTSMSGEGGIRTRERGKPPLRDFQSRSLSQLGHLSGAGAVCHRLCPDGHRDGRLAPARSTRDEVWGMPDERIDILRRVSLFDDLSDRELEAVANAAKERRFDTGDTVVGEGEGGVGFFVVADGTARVEVSGQRRCSGRHPPASAVRSSRPAPRWCSEPATRTRT